MPASNLRTDAGRHLRRHIRLELETLEERAVPAFFSVTPGGSIQQAINLASSGDTIMVLPGTYTESLMIPSTKTGLQLITAGVVTIRPTAGLAGDVVDIQARNVMFRGFTVNGGGNAQQLLAAGIGVDSAGSATIQNDTITGLYNGTIDQTGVGILVSGGSSATIVSDKINSYQKGGIVVTGASTYATIQSNTITGVVEAPNVAQNGIQVDTGARASISNNTISNNSFPGNVAATGVLLYFAGIGTSISLNSFTANDVGVFLDHTSNASLTNNSISHQNFEGIFLNVSNNNLISGNTVAFNNLFFILSDIADLAGLAGISLLGSSNNQIVGGSSQGNNGNGILINGGQTNLISRCSIALNGRDGVNLLSTTGNTIVSCTISHNGGNGVTLDASSWNTVAQNLINSNGGAAVLQTNGSSNNTIQ
jgi:parallel beta-helix repeat protein